MVVMSALTVPGSKKWGFPEQQKRFFVGGYCWGVGCMSSFPQPGAACLSPPSLCPNIRREGAFSFSQKITGNVKRILKRGRDQLWGPGIVALVGGENTRAAGAQGLNCTFTT